MIRSRPFLDAMHRLAVLAALLMLCAPLVSRWAQSRDGDGMVCTDMGMQSALPALAAPQHHGMAMTMSDASMAMSMPVADHPMDNHGGHEAACEYCVLAASLLPVLLLLLIVLPLLRVAAPPLPRPIAALRPQRWAAHAARGPPLLA